MVPAWSSTLRAVLCHTPNSAPPERAFSILNGSIGDDQTCAKADYKKALMMLRTTTAAAIKEGKVKAGERENSTPLL
jgi:hypothetical protein